VNLSSFARRLLQIADAATFRTIIGVDASGTAYTPGGTDVAVADGGTGRSSHTAYAVICGGTTSTSAQQSVAALGSSGDILTSNGAGALPTFQAPAAQPNGYTFLGTITTTSGSSQSLTGLTLTNYKFMRCSLNGVSVASNGSSTQQNGQALTGTNNNTAYSGLLDIDLSTGAAMFGTSGASGGYVSNVTTASTSIVFTCSGGNFDAGSIRVYAI
jgi:hypothetical protein